MSGEQWRAVVGYERAYELSDQGRVRSVSRSVRSGLGTRTIPSKVLAADPTGNGYPSVQLSVNGRSKTMAVHRLVLEAFVGPCPKGGECCHGNGTRADNRLVNLRWGTHTDNCDDQRLHGTKAVGERSGTAKLSRATVERVVLPGLVAGVSFAAIARESGVSESSIRRVANGDTWRHITGGYIPRVDPKLARALSWPGEAAAGGAR